MSRPIEQALLSLLPSQNSNLPPPLVELASSLLAQSRNRASTLKAEEEVARTYACANLACDRLKITLNLPPIEPRPPVPPRIYRRLYTLLDKVLPATSLAGRPKAHGLGTPRSKGLSSPASRAAPSRGTPTKEVSLSQFRTPSKTSTASNLNPRSATRQNKSALPPWLVPTVRHLCTSLSTGDGPDLAPTVVAGLEATVAPYRKRTQDEWVNGHFSPLAGAIYWFVSESAGLAPGEEMTAETSRARYRSMRRDILRALRSARDEVNCSAPTARAKKTDLTEEQEAAFWDGWQESIQAADLDEAITEVTERGWLNSDWYRSIEFLRDKAEDADDQNLGREDSALAAATVQITKADTMLQDKFDYLSGRRRADYRQWKADVMQRIDLLERVEDADAMHVNF